MKAAVRPRLLALARPGVRLRRLNAVSWIALAVILVLALVALLAPVLAPYSPNELSADTGGPSGAHWFGVDDNGRDVFTRLLFGTRWSLAIGLLATAFALLCGAVLGAFTATAGKHVDELVMRVLDVIMAFPGIALAAVLVAVFGRDIPVLVLAIGFLYVPQVTRVVRANVLAQYAEDYVAAEKTIGARRFYTLTRHVAVNCAAPVLVFCTILVADAIVFESSLSFIGAGIQPPDPSWGSVLADGKDQVLIGGWWATLFPGLLILITVLALNVLAEGISDAWAAPSARPQAQQAVARELARAASENQPVELPAEQLRAAADRLGTRDLGDAPTVLEVRHLSVSFPQRHRGNAVVQDISFTVRAGEVLGLIGESGCGKSLTALAVMGLQPPGAVLGGEVLFGGTDLLTTPAGRRRRLMGREIVMVYQDALSSLNPALTVRSQLKQVVRRGGRRSPEELLRLVGLDPDRTLRAYPHELSGGQRQRVLIALALSRDPKLIIADEPTTALDVTVQAQVMQLLLRLQAELGFALVLVSHDLALVAELCDRVVVMYAGQVAETGHTAALIARPRHHYTRGLLASVVSIEQQDAVLAQIKGVVPAPADFSPGCRFAGRCPVTDEEVCPTRLPPVHGTDDHQVSCHYPHEVTR
ncbi:dipeptide/oligopeptide/nickel ABC transporter permease/ATP-binding protein [Kineosporia sp. J2-2]|uniref:Dipeptide/oligopeptide/nickel ABC transporter permease/ATP-binding protein n=1 Tax=Kineosporia corallincola TaxID=2835133 RepID=A0ABS5THZ1_9ACTN|nr:dipeptide/oligopeptide/nickel ABC transporter permease/ATP-binding protein [Kineosporia corallincola]MBT0770719.1 dipeptide/oligopeptide/nickel ABC transporter permease/ATP-binding protein [Kineosporia corallincola]